VTDLETVMEFAARKEKRFAESLKSMSSQRLQDEFYCERDVEWIWSGERWCRQLRPRHR
jgi:hypothetical protein